MSRYWKEVATRAWRDSLTAMGWEDRSKLMVNVDVSLFVLILVGQVAAYAQVIEQAAAWGTVVVASLVMFALVFVGSVVAIIPKLDQERINALESAHPQPGESALGFVYKEGEIPYTPTARDHPLCIGIKNFDPSELIRNVQVDITGDFPRGEMPLPLRLLDSHDIKVDLSSGKTAYFEVGGVSKYRTLVICGIDKQTHHLGTYKIKLKAYGEGTGSTNVLFTLEATEDGAKLLPRLADELKQS